MKKILIVLLAGNILIGILNIYTIYLRHRIETLKEQNNNLREMLLISVQAERRNQAGQKY